MSQFQSSYFRRMRHTGSDGRASPRHELAQRMSYFAMADEDDDPWDSPADSDTLWDYAMEHHCNEIWPLGDFRWQPHTIYIPYYRQLKTGRRWAGMTYARDAWRNLGGQDDPEWDHMLVTAVIGMDGEI